ncbi:MAG TPA: tRNA (adenosine(37)-N6)-threonylcarbamoyltransferase complex dimerization subunit type 1 TsaB, partial [Kofleriaceae bacterium]|nr:tRNA (adenosine(37)-N6)-threonylcarbamoyltransferase complex dimerization subunit type 1 TsaB [Kofleriaceae bacterium]
MIVLAVDTSTMTTSVAVLDGPHPAAHAADVHVRAAGRSVARPASDNLLPLIERALADAGLAAAAVDAYAVGAGPGSFTGLRIGMATIKGLAFAAGKPVWAVSSLEALALDAGAADGTLVAAVVDARRGEVFAGWFRRRADLLEPLGP